MPQYDETFRLFFKHLVIMQSLLRGIGVLIGLPKPWFDAVDPNGLVQLSTMFVSDKLKATYGDSAWFAPFLGAEGMVNGKHRGIVFHQEFQSTVVPTMAFRLDGYDVQLQYDLWRAGLTPLDELTAVVSIVTFNRLGGWSAPLDTGDLYKPIGGVHVSSVLGSRRHLLLDMCAMDLRTLPENELISCIIRQQAATEGRQVWDVLKDVYRLIPGDHNKDLRGVFHQAAVNSPHIPGDIKFPGFDELERLHNQGGNVTTLLDHNMKIWHNQMLDEGRTEGISIGMMRGRTEGISIGRTEGLVEGERRVLLRQTTSLFGADIAERLTVLLDRIDDPEHLTNLSEVLVKCKTGEEFLSQVERGLD